MEKEFIPYEQALDLKELGFDEPCFGYWSNWAVQEPFLLTCELGKEIESASINRKNILFKAPTFSQAFRWFRDKYNLHSYITCSCTVNEILSYDWVIHKVMNSGTRDENFITDYERTYEDAELNCLKKLIEIVKEK
jgi:hypothetical protein